MTANLIAIELEYYGQHVTNTDGLMIFLTPYSRFTPRPINNGSRVTADQIKEVGPLLVKIHLANRDYGPSRIVANCEDEKHADRLASAHVLS